MMLNCDWYFCAKTINMEMNHTIAIVKLRADQ